MSTVSQNLLLCADALAEGDLLVHGWSHPRGGGVGTVRVHGAQVVVGTPLVVVGVEAGEQLALRRA